MTNKVLDKMLSDITSYEDNSFSAVILNRLDKILLLYISEIDTEYTKLLGKKGSKSLLKELCKL